jgi:hypothetical protein
VNIVVVLAVQGSQQRQKHLHQCDIRFKTDSSEIVSVEINRFHEEDYKHAKRPGKLKVI